MAMNRLKKSRLSKSEPSKKKNQQATAGYNQSFIEYLRSECHLADNTVKAYGRDMVHFQNWLAGRNIVDLTVAQLSDFVAYLNSCLLYTSPSPRDKRQSRMPSSA